MEVHWECLRVSETMWGGGPKSMTLLLREMWEMIEKKAYHIFLSHFHTQVKLLFFLVHKTALIFCFWNLAIQKRKIFSVNRPANQTLSKNYQHLDLHKRKKSDNFLPKYWVDLSFIDRWHFEGAIDFFTSNKKKLTKP